MPAKLKTKKFDFTIVIPAWNEEEVIEETINAIENYFKNKNFELLIVNDGSADNTKKIVEKLMSKYSNLRLINHEKNMGMGAALNTGFNNASSEIIVNMDADLTHPLDKIEEMANLIKQGYDVVIGSRYIKGGGYRGVPFFRRVISFIGGFVIFRIIFLSRIRDMTSGFRAYNKRIIKELNLQSKRFETPLEISVKILKKGLRFKEIPIILDVRKKGVSKFNYIKALKTYAPTIIKLFFYRWFGKD
ncbi:MAG: glycosyltransferase [Candidatus Woesearchaeota archaeon]